MSPASRRFFLNRAAVVGVRAGVGLVESMKPLIRESEVTVELRL